MLTPEDRALLARRRLAARRRFRGRIRGERTSRQKGLSIEFADFRDYTSGDDLRSLDWNILARLDRATIRTYQDEDDLAVYLLLDTSASMDFGRPAKFDAARKAAAALGNIALAGHDSLLPMALGARRGRMLRGRACAGELMRWLESRRAEATDSFLTALRQLASGALRPGMALCLTDALDPEAADAFRAVAARGHELVVVQILSQLELEPQIEGDLRLVDCETGEHADITATSAAVRLYKQNLEAHCQAVARAVSRSGGHYVRLESHAMTVDTLIRELRRMGAIE